MKTPPNATAWLKLVVLDEGRDAMMVARPTPGCGGDRVAIGHMPNAPGVRWEVPAAINRPLKFGRSALEFVRAGWVHSETEVTS
jgi:hypothetical protein